jgi:hypothetical protein
MRPTSPSNWNKLRARLPRAAALTAAAAQQRPGQAGHVRDDRPGHLRIPEASAAATPGTGSSARAHRPGQSSGRRLMLDSVRSPSGTLVAQRDDRWSQPSHEIRRSGRQAQLWDALFGCDRSGRSVHGARGLAWLCRCAGVSHRLTRPGESKGPPETPGWFTTAGWPRSVASKIGSWTHSAVRTTCLSAKRNSQGMSLTPCSTGTSVGGPRVSCSRPRRIRQVPAALMFRYQSD